jgi:exodeoxyribonuclease-5
MNITLSADQEKALQSTLDWYKSPHQFVTLGGYAGTGKSTLISVFREEIHKDSPKLRVAFCSYTGKAARVIESKLLENSTVHRTDNVSTIHGLIYEPLESIGGEIVGWQKKENLDYDLIIVDEASMVDNKIWLDLCSFGIPILAVGDHGQLPPIKGDFNLMQKPQIKLETIHRQAEENPIIQLSIMARQNGHIPMGVFSDGVKKIDRNEDEASELIQDALNDYNEDTLVLCGYNHTRTKLNQFVRGALEFESIDPVSGDTVICLRNNHQKNIYNGMKGIIKYIEPDLDQWFYAEIKMDGNSDLYKGLIYGPQFGSSEPINFTKDRKILKDRDIFDFGYASTVHKAQGSQANKVILFEERFKKMSDTDWRRWLYTGITRAESELLIIGLQ